MEVGGQRGGLCEDMGGGWREQKEGIEENEWMQKQRDEWMSCGMKEWDGWREE